MARRKHEASLKAKVALEAIKGDMTIAEICTKYEVGPTQVKTWKGELLKNMSLVFVKNKSEGARYSEDECAVLERKVGQLTIENDFLKKNWVRYQRKNGS